MEQARFLLLWDQGSSLRPGDKGPNEGKEAAVLIQGILNASTIIAEVGRSGGLAAPNAVPVHDLMLAGIAIGIWAIAIACIVSWTRARERARARAHIRWMRFSRRDPHPNLLPGPGEGTEASKTGSSGGQAALFMDELPRVQGHGGRIFVDTTGGDGTCYTLELRVRQEG